MSMPSALPPMISYAQNAEDVLLRRAFPEQVRGLYIDVGANHPVQNSVTKHFYDRGWSGINIEPDQVFSVLEAGRPRDVNLNLGVSDRSGELTFYEFGNGLSTFSRDEALAGQQAGYAFRERTVPVTTLAEICERHVTRDIDFLSVDVEGHERQVLLGADWNRWRPRIVLVEATRPATTIPTHGAWEHILLEADYAFATFDGLNRYYVRGEDQELLTCFETPANIFDHFIPYRYYRQISVPRRRLVRWGLRLKASRRFRSWSSAGVRCLQMVSAGCRRIGAHFGRNASRPRRAA